jgi:hypothetical protein
MKIKLDRNYKYYVFIKAAVYVFLFRFLHYIYEWTGNNVIVGIFSSVDESIFQHMKMAFYTYLIVTLIEFLIFKDNIDDPKEFMYSRLLSLLLVPWFVQFLYFTAAMFGHIDNYYFELIYSISIGYLSIIPIIVLEKWYAKLEIPKHVKVLIIILIVLLVAQFTVFTFFPPWHDVFANPPGW